MLRSKRKRYTLRAREPAKPRPTLPTVHGAWDVWLLRLSHFAQFGLFLFTVGSLYFTVIPLYQKAVLEEAIAKREVELKHLNDRFAVAYKRLRIYAVRDFQMDAMPQCAGLYSPPRSASPVPAPSGATPTRAELVFSVDIERCLLQVLGTANTLADISIDDRKQFEEELRKVIENLKSMQQRAIQRYREVPAELSDSEAKDLPGDSYRVQWLEVTARVRGLDAAQLERRKLAAALRREAIGTEYERAISTELQSLRKTVWRSDSP